MQVKLFVSLDQNFRLVLTNLIAYGTTRLASGLATATALAASGIYLRLIEFGSSYYFNVFHK